MSSSSSLARRDAAIQCFHEQLLQSWPLAQWQDVDVLVALSGGRDSVALLRALAAIKNHVGSGRLVAAHFNHGWRGGESDTDEQFVRALCADLGIACLVGGPARAAASARREAVARSDRYRFLGERARMVGARYVVTGHTADDQAETVLHRLVRGTGLRGLRGIPRVRRLGPYTAAIRPLLNIRRQQIDEYLDALEQPAREDSSNRDLRWTRNRIRHELLPQLHGYNAQVVESIGRLASLASEAHEVLDELTDQLLSRHVQFEPATPALAAARIDCPPLQSAPPYLVRQMLVAIWSHLEWPQQDMTYEHWQKLAQRARAVEGTSKEVFPGAVMAERAGEVLRLYRVVGPHESDSERRC